MKRMLEQIKEEENYYSGNDLLYFLCEKEYFKCAYNYLSKGKYTDNEENKKRLLSAKIWLIGRSYAASPERRNYKNYIVEGEKFGAETSGDGLDSFFDELAGELYGEGYAEIEREIEQLRNAELTESTLQQGISLVQRFNEKIKRAIVKVDEKELLSKVKDTYKERIYDIGQNRISFCSKFLHFHLPQLIFIFDSISNKNLCAFYNTKNQSNGFKNNKGERVSLSEDIRERIIKKAQEGKEKADTPAKIYAQHAWREYYVSKEYGLTPRQTDTFIMRLYI